MPALNLMVAAGGLLLARGVDRAGGEARPKVVSELVFVGGFLDLQDHREQTLKGRSAPMRIWSRQSAP